MHVSLKFFFVSIMYRNYIPSAYVIFHAAGGVGCEGEGEGMSVSTVKECSTSCFITSKLELYVPLTSEQNYELLVCLHESVQSLTPQMVPLHSFQSKKMETQHSFFINTSCTIIMYSVQIYLQGI